MNLLGADRDPPPVAVEHVRDADETGYELRLRMLVHLRGRAELLDASIVEDGHPVAHRERLFLIVCDVDERDAEIALQIFQEHLHLLAQLQVERSKGLIQQ